MEQQQHEKISGYRTLTEEEISDVNEVKAIGNRMGELIEKFRMRGALPGAKCPGPYSGYDQRWLSIGATHIQEGCSALVRAVTRPEGFI